MKLLSIKNLQYFNYSKIGKKIASTYPKGAFSFNMVPSEKRTESAKACFIKNGISSARIIAEGYGETIYIKCPKETQCS